jgi:hypothetical protein
VSRIYVVVDRQTKRAARYVRAHTLNSAARAVTSELFEVQPASGEDICQASKLPGFDVLDAVDDDGE